MTQLCSHAHILTHSLGICLMYKISLNIKPYVCISMTHSSFSYLNRAVKPEQIHT